MQNAFRRIDDAGKEGRSQPPDAALAKYIGRH
jgi:hypothetical protein